jgi:hypothetical protein
MVLVVVRRSRCGWPALELTEPETVPIAPAQYRQAVDLLAVMITDYAIAHPPDECPKTAGEEPASED